MVIHDIKVQHISASINDSLGFFPQPRKVG
jgi:hypothetical protein